MGLFEHCGQQRETFGRFARCSARFGLRSAGSYGSCAGSSSAGTVGTAGTAAALSPVPSTITPPFRSVAAPTAPRPRGCFSALSRRRAATAAGSTTANSSPERSARNSRGSTGDRRSRLWGEVLKRDLVSLERLKARHRHRLAIAANTYVRSSNDARAFPPGACCAPARARPNPDGAQASCRQLARPVASSCSRAPSAPH
jgi:hypothetical protein